MKLYNSLINPLPHMLLSTCTLQLPAVFSSFRNVLRYQNLVKFLAWNTICNLEKNQSFWDPVVIDKEWPQIMIHAGKLTFWTPKIGGGWKMIFLFNRVIFRFHVHFQGCRWCVVWCLVLCTCWHRLSAAYTNPTWHRAHNGVIGTRVHGMFSCFFPQVTKIVPSKNRNLKIRIITVPWCRDIRREPQ